MPPRVFHFPKTPSPLVIGQNRRVTPQLQTMTMMARTVGLWEASRHPDMTTGEVLSDLFACTRKAVRLSTKRGMIWHGGRDDLHNHSGRPR